MLLFRMEAGHLKHDSLAPHGWPVRTRPHFHPSKAIHSLCLIHSGKSFREFTPVLGPGRKRHDAALQPLRAVILREVWQLLGVPNTLSRAFQGQGYFSHSTKMSFAFPLLFSQPILYSHKFFPRPAQRRHGLCGDQAFLFVYLFLIFGGHASQHVGSYFPSLGSNLHPLYWKYGILAIGPPGRFLSILFEWNC